MQHSPFSNLKNPLMQLINLHAQTMTKLMTELPLLPFYFSSVFLTSSLRHQPSRVHFFFSSTFSIISFSPFTRPSYPIPLLRLRPIHLCLHVPFTARSTILSRSNSQIAFMKSIDVFGSIGWLQRHVKSPSTT